MTLTLESIEPDSPLFDRSVDFIRSREWRAVSLASHLAGDGAPVYPGKHIARFTALVDAENPGAVVGVFLVTVSGILLHCVQEGLDRSTAQAALIGFLRGLTIRCILGPREDSLYLESLIAIEPYQSVDYELMRLHALPEEALTSIPEGLKAIRASEGDAEALLPLQEGYEREEVIPPGDPFDRAACRINLKRALGKQLIDIVQDEKGPVAKAGTNARGFAYDQIGGVFTVPAWRGKGLATALVARVSREIMTGGKSVVLFVKPGNLAARNAYRKVGFRAEIPYRISYF